MLNVGHFEIIWWNLKHKNVNTLSHLYTLPSLHTFCHFWHAGWNWTFHWMFYLFWGCPESDTSITFAIRPSLPARPTSCQYTNMARGAPQWMTVSASNMSIPIPNAKVAITQLSDVPLKGCNTLTLLSSSLFLWNIFTRPFLSCGMGTVALSCSSRCSQVYRSQTVLNTFFKQLINLKTVAFYFHINFTHENASLFLSHISYYVKFLCPIQGVWHCT